MGTTGDDELRRMRILRAAAELLEHYGTQKTTVADIARRAGVAVGSVYLEFDSKDALVGTLSELRHARVLEAMREAAAAAQGEPADAAAAICRAMRARTCAFIELARCGMHGRDLMHCGGRSGIALARERFAQREHALLVALLEAGQHSAQLAVTDPTATATALVDAHVAFAPPLLFTEHRGDPLRALDALHQLLVEGLRARR